MALLRVTPEELAQCGQSLVGMSREIGELLQRLDVKVQEVQFGWDGLAQEGYVEMYQQLKQTLTKVPGFVEDLGQKTVHVAQTFEDVDMSLGKRLMF